jgi:hypothetical protein
MRVGLLTIHIHLYQTKSLKEKRSIIKGLLADIKRRGPAFAAAEIDYHDDLRLATIRVAHLSNDPQHTDSVLTRLRTSIESSKDYNVEGYELEIL